MSRKKDEYPVKQTLNLYYKTDRTTKPATIALYVLFVLTCCLGIFRFLVYDLWQETREAERALAAAEAQLEGMTTELLDYSQVQERYFRYSATEEEQALTDRMEILELLERTVGSMAEISSISVSGDTVQAVFSSVTLAETARIVSGLEASPVVAETMVNTASTIGDPGASVQTSILIRLTREGTEE